MGESEVRRGMGEWAGEWLLRREGGAEGCFVRLATTSAGEGRGCEGVCMCVCVCACVHECVCHCVSMHAHACRFMVEVSKEVQGT